MSQTPEELQQAAAAARQDLAADVSAIADRVRPAAVRQQATTAATSGVSSAAGRLTDTLEDALNVGLGVAGRAGLAVERAVAGTPGRTAATVGVAAGGLGALVLLARRRR